MAYIHICAVIELEQKKGLSLTSYYCKMSLLFLLSLPLHPFLWRRPFCVFVAGQRLLMLGDSSLWDKCRVISALQLGRSSKILAKISNWLHSRAIDFGGTNFAVRLLLMQFRSAFNRDMMKYHPTTQEAKSGTGTVKSKKKKKKFTNPCKCKTTMIYFLYWGWKDQ